MKKTIIVFILLLLLISLCVYEQVYVHKVFSEYNADIDKVIEAYEDTELCESRMTSFIAKWEKGRHCLECYVSHSDLIEVELLINESKGSIISGQKDVALSSLIRLKETMRYTAHVLDFQWEHVL